MTLIEILVAFMAFVMLVTALVSLARSGLDTWTEGENRKDVYDRAQAVLDLITEDLRNAYAENEWTVVGSERLQPPALLCDADRNGRPHLRFVRTGGDDLSPVLALSGGARTAAVPGNAGAEYGDHREVAYRMDEDPTKFVLYRGTKTYSRKTKGSLFDDKAFPGTRGSAFDRHFTRIDDGVLHVGYQFWTQFTNTWDDSHRIQTSISNRTSQKSGPSLLWDSSRVVEGRFFLHRKRASDEDPDFVYPEIVQVSVTVETTAPDVRGASLAQAADAASMRLYVGTTRGMPDAPSFVKVGSEWIEYQDLTHSEIVVKRRGARGTKPAPHAAGEPIRYGPTFVAEVRLPVHREAATP